MVISENDPSSRENHETVTKQISEKVQHIAYLLLLRGIPQREATLITGLSQDQLAGIQSDLIDSQKLLLSEEGSGGQDSTSQNQDIDQRDLSFARQLLNEDFIGEALEAWSFVNNLYQQAGTPLNPVKGIVHEAFLNARAKANLGNQGWLVRYIDLGEKVNRKWFNSSKFQQSEEFIIDHEQEFVVPKLLPKLGYSEDDKSFYRSGQDGEKWRPTDVVGENLVCLGRDDFLRRASQKMIVLTHSLRDLDPKKT